MPGNASLVRLVGARTLSAYPIEQGQPGPHADRAEQAHLRFIQAGDLLQGLTPQQIEANYCKVTPIRRVLQPSEIADVALFLASDRAAAITGESIAVDGGITRGIYI